MRYQKYSKTKQKIIEAAKRVVEKIDDWREASIDDVAKEAKVGKGTIYLYYKNKEDLFFGLMNYLTETACDLISKSFNENEVHIGQLSNLFYNFVGYLRKNSNIFMTLHKEVCLAGKHNKNLLEQQNKLLFLIESKINLLVKNKILKNYNATLLSHIIFSLAIGTANALSHFKSKFKAKDVFEVLLEGIRK